VAQLSHPLQHEYARFAFFAAIPFYNLPLHSAFAVAVV
jgi:hypothetical protein